MARSLVNTTALLSLVTTVRNDVSSTGRATSCPVKLQKTHNLTSGTDSAQADRAFEHKLTITAGTTEVLDLFALVGTDIGAGDGNDVLGLPLALYQIVAIGVNNANVIDTDGLLEVGPDVTDGWAGLGEHTVVNGGALPAQASIAKIVPGSVGLEIVDGVSHRLALTAVGADVECKIVVFGRSEPPASSSSSSSSSGI